MFDASLKGATDAVSYFTQPLHFLLPGALLLSLSLSLWLWLWVWLWLLLLL
jgi:hypothetical protein